MPHQGSQPQDLTGQPVMGADYTKSPAELHVISVDSTGAIITSGGGGSSNPAAGPTGSPVPADADYIGINVGGILEGISASNPLPVTGTITPGGSVNQGNQGTAAESWFVEITDGTNVLGTPSHPIRIDPTGTTLQPVSVPSVSATGAAVPADADYIGFNSGGNLVGVSSSNPLPVTSSISGTVTVVGDAASGSPVAGNPVLIGGSDGTDARTISTNSSGQQVVVGAGTAGTNSGGVLSVQGIASGTTMPVQDKADMTGTVPGTAPSNTLIVGAIYNSSAPAPTTGQTLPLQSDASGNLQVNNNTASTSQTSETNPKTVSSTSSTVIASNTARKECIVVNTGTVVVYLGLNGLVPTATAYNVALSPCTSNDDGTGGVYLSDLVKGAINAIAASTSGKVCVTELI